MAKLVVITDPSPASRLHLRSVIPSDAPSMLARVRDPLCVQYIPPLQSPAKPITLESVTNRIAAWRAESSVKSLYMSIVLGHPGADDARVIGEGGVNGIDLGSKTADCGIMLDSAPDIRGRGYGTEAMRVIISYAFEGLGMEYVELGTMHENGGMRGVMDGLGIKGEMRKVEDDMVYRIGREDWLGGGQHRKVEAVGLEE